MIYNRIKSYGDEELMEVVDSERSYVDQVQAKRIDGLKDGNLAMIEINESRELIDVVHSELIRRGYAYRPLARAYYKVIPVKEETD